MIYSLVFASDYDTIHLSLQENNAIIDSITDSKLYASANLIPALESLLEKHRLPLSDITFIAANQGPGPYTTLRTILATVNGLAYASKIPLVGINGLKAFIDEHSDIHWPATIILLNAFNQELYYGFKHENGYITGYGTIQTVLNLIKSYYPDSTIRFLGNGTLLFAKEIKHYFNTASIANPLPVYASMHAMVTQAQTNWQKQESVDEQLFPLYLKEMK
jgi:tRNA threonylcarbamoyladenosine biosynthesis protein TsaB